MYKIVHFLVVSWVAGLAFASNAQTQSSSAPIKPVTAATAALVDLDARISVETKSIGSDGVTRTSQYGETLMRRGQQVWMQRIRPKQNHEHDHEKESSGHKHLDPYSGGRLISLFEGKPQLNLVLPDKKQIVNIPSVEFGNMGFDGSWEKAYYLISLQEFLRSKLFKVTPRKSEFPEAVWYERKGDVNESILWDNKKMIPRVIESSNAQGTQWRRITVTLNGSLENSVPWRESVVKNYDQMRYSDFLD
jgi:hypothetical protein